MPYSTMDSSALADFEKALADAKKEYKDEKTAHQVAFKIFKNMGYSKGEDGKWHKKSKEGDVEAMTASDFPELMSDHKKVEGDYDGSNLDVVAKEIEDELMNGGNLDALLAAYGIKKRTPEYIAILQIIKTDMSQNSTGSVGYKSAGTEPSG